MIRIKYREIGEGLQESVYDYKSATTGAIYRILIDTNKMIYKITNTNSGRIYNCEKKLTNYKVLLRNLKAHLERLGVEFSAQK
jgi:hypothetical protein